MTAKKVLIAGATGLVGYAAMKHFASQRDCDVIALSRRRPDETYGARFLPLDLTDEAAGHAVNHDHGQVAPPCLRRTVERTVVGQSVGRLKSNQLR